MCGIAGVLFGRTVSPEMARQMVDRMTSALRHRGPDSHGFWRDPQGAVAFGHRRLSILDLSEAGAQPMRSPSGRYVITYNGEIYNCPAIREKLTKLGYSSWRGHSDTEVLLAAFEHWGVEKALPELAGMFAFAVWDVQRSELYLARDRLGEKPLYYGWLDGAFAFASELKAFYAHPAWRGELDRDAIASFLRFGYVPTPYAIFQNVRKLPPASYVVVRGADDRNLSPRPYWSAVLAANRREQPLFAGDDGEAISTLDRLLRNVVTEQMISDVPLGAFLSGGVDSSTVVALMQAQVTRPVKTFTVGFHDPAFNEAAEARAIAAYLGTEHNEIYVTEQEARAVIPQLPNLYDEPFADVSQIPTYLVAALARRHVTVCLSGDGGDELFGGYNRYRWARQIWLRIGGWGPRRRDLLARAMTLLSPAQWDRFFKISKLALPKRWQQRLPGDKIHKLAELMHAASDKQLYLALVSIWKTPTDVVPNAREGSLAAFREMPGDTLEEQMMLCDLLTYLPDDVLAKVDRAAMAVSLEVRVPLLDFRIVQFALGLPQRMKIRDGKTKWLLRQVLYRYVPEKLVERPKMGFGVPIGDWLRGPLRQWADDLLNEARLRREGIFDPGPIRQKWDEHAVGRRAWQYQLWNVLMFQAWLERQRTHDVAGSHALLPA